MPAQPAPPPVPPSSLPPAEQARTFMDALMGDVPDGLHATLWTMPNLKTLWVPTVDGDGAARAANAAMRLTESKKDVYFGVSVARRPGRDDQRVTTETAAGIFGLWIDLDVATPDVHAKWNLPPSIEACHQVLADVGMEPTMVVHSGHGLHAWWLFKEFWRFENDDDRLAAAGLAQRWNATLAARAAERSWVVDSVFDLPRVLRVPGSLNRKGDHPVPVVLEKYDPAVRYDREDFEAFCVDPSYLLGRGISPTKGYVVGDLDLNDAMKPDFDRFDVLRDNSDQFVLTWDRKRRDFADQSASTYDMSLASQAARAGWDDQDIAALILAWRRRHKEDTTKALRYSYVSKTIARAREGMARAVAADTLLEVGDALQDAKVSNDDEAIRPARRAALDAIGALLGLELLHIIKYLSEPAAFAIVTPTTTIPLGDREGILRWDKFRGAIWEAIGEQIPRFPTAAWDQLTALIPRAWEEQDVGSEATERGEVQAWLGAYLASRPPVDTVVEAAQSEYPFLEKDGRVLMFGPAFKRWLYLSDQTRITTKDMGRRLRAYGCEPDKVNVKDATGARTTRSVWRLPAGLGGPPEGPLPPLVAVAS